MLNSCARDAADEAASEVLGYVARLSLEDTDPLNPETWVRENVSSGGGYSAEGAELKLYGTEGARTLEIVVTGLPSDIVPEPSNDPVRRAATERRGEGAPVLHSWEDARNVTMTNAKNKEEALILGA